jgi:hypothetical protein
MRTTCETGGPSTCEALDEPVIVVSGLPRSGTSMMMQMLAAGGLEVLTDDVHQPDDDNPLGYFEYEPVNRLQEDASWMSQVRGKAVKVVSPLLPELPPGLSYKVLFMRRATQEVLISQAKLAKGRLPNEDRLPAVMARHLAEMGSWIEQAAHVDSMYIEYGDAVHDPMGTAKKVVKFLDMPLDIAGMVAAVVPRLYRNRSDPLTQPQ